MSSAPRGDQMPAPGAWESLTVSPQKRELFTEDLYFRECWADVDDVLGHSAGGMLGELALLSFKCDGIAARRGRRTLEYLDENGFRVVGFAGIRQNRHSMRELWRYNWHVYTTDRLALMTLMHSVSDSLMLLLRDERYDGVVPGSVRLAALKGSADPWNRGPQHLRSVLEPPNRIINFVHVADEPADIVRETGILLDRAERRELLRSVYKDWSGDAADLAAARLARLEEECPAGDFGLDAALGRLEASGTAGPEQLARVREAAAGGPRLAWDEFCAVMDPASPRTAVWDFVRIATEVLASDRAASADLLPASLPEEWTARHRPG